MLINFNETKNEQKKKVHTKNCIHICAQRAQNNNGRKKWLSQDK